MRAMGHYPTDMELKNMEDEIRTSNINEKLVETLD